MYLSLNTARCLVFARVIVVTPRPSADTLLCLFLSIYIVGLPYVTVLNL